MDAICKIINQTVRSQLQIDFLIPTITNCPVLWLWSYNFSMEWEVIIYLYIIYYCQFGCTHFTPKYSGLDHSAKLLNW